MYLQKKLYHLGLNINKTIINLQNYKSLIEENKKLKENLIRLALNKVDYLNLKKENTTLKHILQFKRKTGFEVVVANIIGRDFFNHNIIHLNAGKNRGIKKGDAVVYANGILIGKIIETTNTFSKARLLVDNNSEIAGVLENEKINQIIVGYQNNGLKMEFIPESTLVKEGELVITSNLNENIPQNLLIGKVVKIIKQEGQPFQSVLVAPLVNLNNIDMVSVIVNKNVNTK